MSQHENRPSLRTPVSLFKGSDGSTIVHAPLLGKAFKAQGEVLTTISELVEGKDLTGASLATMSSLHQLGLIGEHELPTPLTEPITEFRPLEATLIFTETCNLACSYCYASSTATKASPMPIHIAQAAVDLVIANAQKSELGGAMFRYIGGGEPTVEWELLRSVTDYVERAASKAGVRHFIRLITNGTLLTKERVAWLAHHLDFVTLSFDVLPELQEQRPYISGKSTQNKLLTVIQELSTAGVEFHIRTTVSSAGAGRLVDMVKYIDQHTQAKSIRFEPMAEIGRSLNTSVGKPNQQLFSESFKEAYVLGKELGIEVTCKQFKNLLRRNSRFCDAEFSVAPTGLVSACHRYSREDHNGQDLFRIGMFNGSKFIFDLDKINNVRSIDVNSFNECQTCMAKWNCAGGCLSARVGPNGIINRGPLCDLTRDLLKFSIEQRLESTDEQREKD
ncbi:MAG: radical SAM protein [Rhizobium sp.]|nr:MAG: radical SAM protein [Rhizobium sp.]